MLFFQTGFPYRKLFNRQFKPNDELVSDIPIYILWSVDGGLPHGPFNPNHFVCVTRSKFEKKYIVNEKIKLNKKQTNKQKTRIYYSCMIIIVLFAKKNGLKREMKNMNLKKN